MDKFILEEMIEQRRLSINEGIIDDFKKSRQQKKDTKNKRQKAMDSVLSVIYKSIGTIGNGIGVIPADLDLTIYNGKFLKGTSNNWKIVFGPVETSDELNTLSKDISDQVVYQLNLSIKNITDHSGNSHQASYYKYNIYNSIKKELGKSRFFIKELDNYWKSVNSYLNSSNFENLENEIAEAAAKYGFNKSNIRASTDKYNKYLIITVTMIE